MSSLFAKFTLQAGNKTDPSLAKRWAFDVQRHGGPPIKQQIAQAICCDCVVQRHYQRQRHVLLR